jgi:proteasome lid subunit RPN8/RPN11
MLSEQTKTFIKQHAMSEPDRECCGLIIERDDAFYPMRCQNIHQTPEHFFTIDPKDYLKASSSGKIVGFYHSHKESSHFSEFDKLNSETHNLFSVLYSIKADQFCTYKPQGYRVPYCGREYVHSIVDCFSLVRDYYLRELNINISDITHPYRYVVDKAKHPDNQFVHPILKEHFLANDFVETQQLQKHDVLLLKTPLLHSPAHCAVYIGNNQILHHPFSGKSCIEMYVNWFVTRTKHRMRHSSRI